MKISKDILKLDCAKEADRIAEWIRKCLLTQFHKQGAVLGLSGGIDSSVVASLCVRALGPERVFGLLMPERDSSDDTLRLSRSIAEHLGIRTEFIDITDTLDVLGCYSRRNEAIKSVLPEYNSDYKFKIVLPPITEQYQYRVFSVIAQSPDGTQIKARLTPKAYLEIVAATNFKQRVRKMLEYYHADKFNFAVAGTPNRQEYDQGFFVKLGDGAADLKPIAHLYKTQVYQLAEFLGVPEDIRSRPPTTDTYSMSQTQEEFFFSVSYDKMDLCLYGKNHNIDPADIATTIGLTAEQVESVYQDIDTKRKTTRYLHSAPVLVENIF